MNGVKLYLSLWVLFLGNYISGLVFFLGFQKNKLKNPEGKLFTAHLRGLSFMFLNGLVIFTTAVAVA